MKEVIEGLPSNKTTAGDIPIKILKESGFTFEYLTSCVNEATLSGKFLNSLNSLKARDGFIQHIFYKRFDCFSL